MEMLLRLDQQLFLLLNHVPHNAFFDGFALTLSGIGKAGFIWFVLGAWLFFREEKKNHWFFAPILFAGVVSWFLVEFILKPVIARPRPSDLLSDFSFPSGHATIAFAMAVVLSSVEPKWRRWFYGLAIAISFTRIYLGVHYPLDVLAGALLGFGIGKVTLWLNSMHGSSGRRV